MNNAEWGMRNIDKPDVIEWHEAMLLRSRNI